MCYLVHGIREQTHRTENCLYSASRLPKIEMNLLGNPSLMNQRAVLSDLSPKQIHAEWPEANNSSCVHYQSLL
ncbi:hypothetical protein D3C71_1772660 [compost metagenome]